MVDPHEQLRGKEPTAEGTHLPEPDAFPHVVMGQMAMIIVFIAGGALASYYFGGVLGLIVGSMFLLFVFMPMAISRLNRAAQANRVADLEEEHEIEAEEQLAAARASHVVDDHRPSAPSPGFAPAGGQPQTPDPATVHRH